MARVPGAERAIVEEAKIKYYLLDERHANGGPKAKFFIGLGFRPDVPEILRESLLEHVQDNDAQEVETKFGKRYMVDAPIRTPSGQMPWVRTVWEVKGGPPRLITAFPTRAES